MGFDYNKPKKDKQSKEVETEFCVDGKVCGCILWPSALSKYFTIRIAVKSGLSWTWHTIKSNFKTESDCKNYLSNNYTNVTKLGLHFFDNN